MIQSFTFWYITASPVAIEVICCWWNQEKCKSKTILYCSPQNWMPGLPQWPHTGKCGWSLDSIVIDKCIHLERTIMYCTCCHMVCSQGEQLFDVFRLMKIFCCAHLVDLVLLLVSKLCGPGQMRSVAGSGTVALLPLWIVMKPRQREMRCKVWGMIVWSFDHGALTIELVLA
jgi:hypothetical protein